MVIKYTQAQYNAKITVLEEYKNQLQGHLTTMENYKSQMFQFWDDANAQETGRALTTQIRQVKNAMQRTDDMLVFYKGAVAKLDGAKADVGSTIAEALGVLEGLGI